MTSQRWTASTSRSSRGPCSVCSDRTAQAKRLPCGSWRRRWHPTRATPRCSASTSCENPAAVRARIGLAGQYAAVDPNLTGRENLFIIGKLSQIPKKVAAERADELLERFELVDAADRPVRTYSGGMRRRLDIGAALVHRPPVLFLDEPTTGLDLPSRNALWTMIRELVTQGSTVLLTTQYLEEADQLAERVAVIDEGKVIANDSPTDLKTRLGSTVIELSWSQTSSAERAEDDPDESGDRDDRARRRHDIGSSPMRARMS